MEIRNIKENEVEQLVPLMQILFSKWEELDRYDKLDQKYFRGETHTNFLKEHIKKSNLIIAVENKEIIGFIDAEIKERPKLYQNKKEGQINLLYIKEEHRSKGAGKKLIEEVLNIFKENNITFITVNTHARDKEANEFWEKRSFRKYNIQYIMEENKNG